ncbi:hypothetical protein M440DRAFT_1327982 [Trichoderma longibrachiatum ATCC 18648]|uniref:GPI inositol-deacylase winged helix domain-containing protein n=1 Tax=Trichoderma longibrachiatum ATCC 18648 TaxID=983965 RepID=A0A2T4CAY5_TRILO|nr:hypothetical protein M440DRAFT_1327982 [Trichoderma longibrachiatum ATCC 18648]
MDGTKEGVGTVHDKYTRIIQSILANKRGISVAKSLWTWIILARRPLTIEELLCAVELDRESGLLDPKRSLSDLCGELITIDAEDRINIADEIIREILLDQKIKSDLTVDREEGHTRIAVTLLKLLSDKCLLKDPFGGPPEPAFESPIHAPLFDYATTFFMEHVFFCPPAENGVMKGLCAFLTYNVFSWREYVAGNGNIGAINQTAEDLRRYAARRAEAVPTDRSISIVKKGASRLLEFAGDFHHNRS